MGPNVEVLEPSLTKGQARSLESSARRHWRAASRNALVFAAELRRLHDGGAHLVRGFENFAVYAEQTFDGLSANAAKQLSRQGGVLLSLERRGRVDLGAPNLPGGDHRSAGAVGGAQQLRGAHDADRV